MGQFLSFLKKKKCIFGKLQTGHLVNITGKFIIKIKQTIHESSEFKILRM